MKKKKKSKADDFEKLLNLTKLISKDKVKIEPTALSRGPNKWRSKDPKFSPKTEKPANVVEAGGMQVDPALKDAYENWRLDKIAEQNERRLQAERNRAAKRARYARENAARQESQ